jgi:hypothetical protein
MPINRAEILGQLQTQLTQQLGENAEVSLLEMPSSPTAKPQVVLKLGEETIDNGFDYDAGQPRQLQLSVQTQALPAASTAVLQSLDSLAESIEVAFGETDEATLWMNLRPRRTTFTYSAANDELSATMTQHFVLEYLVLREEVCPAVPVTEVYLSTQGGPHELVAALPTAE